MKSEQAVVGLRVRVGQSTGVIVGVDDMSGCQVRVKFDLNGHTVWYYASSVEPESELYDLAQLVKECGK